MQKYEEEREKVRKLQQGLNSPAPTNTSTPRGAEIVQQNVVATLVLQFPVFIITTTPSFFLLLPARYYT